MKGVAETIHVMLYLKTVLMANKYKYAYGRKVTEKQYKKDVIVLPVKDNGSPDWKFMDTYMKHLPYGNIL